MEVLLLKYEDWEARACTACGQRRVRHQMIQIPRRITRLIQTTTSLVDKESSVTNRSFLAPLSA